MKTFHISLFVLVSFISAMPVGVANAATEKWSYTIAEDGGLVTWIADGSGGVALMWQGASQEGVIWLDRNGAELYKSQPYPFDADSWIIGVKAKGLLYSRSSGTNVAVSRDGSETTVLGDAPNPLIDNSVYVDRRGFFLRTGNAITRFDF